MKVRSFRQIESIAWMLALGLLVGAWLRGNRNEWFGVALGAGLSIGNAFIWRKLLTRFLHKDTFSDKSLARSALYKLLLIGQGKLVVLGIVLYVMIHKLSVHVGALLLGISVIPAAVFVWGVYHLFQVPKSTTVAAGHQEETDVYK